MLGLAAVPTFALAPVSEFIGAFLASVIHETGHVAAAFLCGMLALPEISAVEHASAAHSAQSPILVVIIGIALLCVAGLRFEGPARWTALALTAVLYPWIALTEAKELLHLLAGHGAELVFSALCLWAALDGGFTRLKLGRLLCSTIGWYLLVRHFGLCSSLVHSTSLRALYTPQQHFVLANDYVRIAVNLLACPPKYVVLTMTVASLLVLPAAIFLWVVRRAKLER